MGSCGGIFRRALGVNQIKPKQKRKANGGEPDCEILRAEKRRKGRGIMFGDCDNLS